MCELIKHASLSQREGAARCSIYHADLAGVKPVESANHAHVCINTMFGHRPPQLYVDDSIYILATVNYQEWRRDKRRIRRSNQRGLKGSNKDSWRAAIGSTVGV